jgi:hypothetical protein
LGVLKGSLKATWKLRVAKSGNPLNLTWPIPAKGKQDEVMRESESDGYLGSLIFVWRQVVQTVEIVEAVKFLEIVEIVASPVIAIGHWS